MTVLSWIPDWAWPLLPWWPAIVIVAGAGMAYRFAGWPGVAAFFGGVGFLAGRRSVKQEAQAPTNPESPWHQKPTAPVPHPRPNAPAKKVTSPINQKKRKTLQDWIKSLNQ